MSEIREQLKPYVGERIKVRGTLSRFADWEDRSHGGREIGRACIEQPEVDNVVVADHVWVMGVLHWLPYKAAIGHDVEFCAVVKEYTDSQGFRNYNLVNPDQLSVLHGPPALSIPDPPAPKTSVPFEKEELSMPDKSQSDVRPTDDPVQLLRQMKTFVKTVGGPEQAKRLLEALGAVEMPVLQLVELVKELCE
jgi:hypothetical protein